ncbi:MAG: hypothetical protein EBU93_02780 [Chlamydiae bacterium]|jgi:hypothetical protein|nr:hypothetical protein [Chlamydiota bacterium]
MKKQSIKKLSFTIFCFFSSFCFSEGLDDLFESLKKSQQIKKTPLPTIYNTHFITGYINMPSGKMNEMGTNLVGYSFFYPYQNIGVNFQIFPFFEAALNYKIFIDKPEDHFGSYGFGDDADRMANMKFAFDPKRYFGVNLPIVAIGLDDFYGSQRFFTPYIVVTQLWPDEGVEASIGYGFQRMKGAFFGLNYSPFLSSHSIFLKGSTFILEYDNIDYAHSQKEHPLAKTIKSRFNCGYQLSLFNCLQFKVASFRGEKVVLQGGIHYNFGQTTGLFPKTQDPNFYTFPKNYEEIGHLRSEKEAAYLLADALLDQGFFVTEIFLTTDEKLQLVFQVHLINLRYWRNEEVKERITSIVEHQFPENVQKIIVTIDENSIPCESYIFEKSQKPKLVEAIQPPDSYDGKQLFYRKKTVASWLIRPRLLSFFGSTSGKYKYALSLIGGPQGYLFDQIYYKVLMSYNLQSSIDDLSDIDFYDPSQLLCVRSDSVRYFQKQSFSLEQAYLQRGFNLGKGFYFRTALGYFEPAYAGVGVEALYFPVSSSFAVGVEAASVLKRNYKGLGFQSKVRKLNGLKKEYVPFVGIQYFLDGYYYFKPFDLEFKISIGQFLAKDKGVQIDIAKYYQSGLRIGYWMTITNAKDTVHDQIYYNKGISFSLPLDIFLTKSSRNFLGYGLAFWLRDSGAKALTGKELYPTLIRAREY